jgi:phosphatidylglycerol---prolipoprotein diacylglyceryl transferase
MIPAYFFPFIEIGTFTIPTYPLMHSLAYVVAGIIILFEARRRGVDLSLVYNTMLYGFVGAIVGARIGGIVNNWDYFTVNPDQIFNLASGGWTESGGFILSFSLMIAYLRFKKFSLLSFFDIAAPAFALRFAISRIGCGAVHDHIGKIMERPWPWGVEYEGLIRHETGLYSLFSNTVIFILLWNLRTKIKTRGMLFTLYLFMYAMSVFIIRFFRAESLPLVSNERYLGLTSTQYIAIAVFIVALVLYRYIKKHPIPVTAPHHVS